MSMSTWIVLVILGYVVGGVLFLFSRCLTAKGEAHGGHEAPVVAPTFGSAMCGLTGIALILLSFWTTIHLMQTPEQFGKRHAYFHGLDAPQPPVGTPIPAASAVGGTPPAPKFVASTEAPPKAIHKTKSKKLFVSTFPSGYKLHVKEDATKTHHSLRDPSVELSVTNVIEVRWLRETSPGVYEVSEWVPPTTKDE